MSKTKLLATGIIGLLLLNGGMLLYILSRQRVPAAEGPVDVPQRGGAARFIIDKLQLDSVQRQQFRLLAEAHRQFTQPVREQNRLLHQQYFGLLKKEPPDMQTAGDLQQQMERLQRQADSATFAHFRAVRALCNDQQKKIFDEVIDEIARRIGMAGGPPPRNARPGGPPPPDPPPGNGEMPPPPPDNGDLPPPDKRPPGNGDMPPPKGVSGKGDRPPPPGEQ